MLRILAAFVLWCTYLITVAWVSPSPTALPAHARLTPSDERQLFMSLSTDLALGQRTAAEIEANTAEYPILDPAQHPETYAYIQKIVNNLLASGQVRYARQFPWRVRIINKDVLNAFCAPGGYIYVYTGLINFLDAEYELAGVMGHEMAHADRRHTSRQIEKTYGLQLITAVALRNNTSGAVNQAAQLAQGLAGLSFSRSHEREADEWSVRYMCNTGYPAFGAARFFEKLQQMQQGQRQPQFLSTHPDPGNRVQSIRNRATQMACRGNNAFDADYAAFKRALPPMPPAAPTGR